MRGNTLVTLVNPNKIHPTITPYALDIITTSLEQAGFTVDVVDLNFRRDDWATALTQYFSDRSPLLVGVTVRNTDTIYPQEQRVFIGEHREIITEIKRLTTAPVVAGGVGFSSMPFALVDYFDIDYGVKGPGEVIMVQLAQALIQGGSAWDVPGLIINEGTGMATMVEVLLGMPGETIDTLRECVDRVMALDATVVGFTLGLRAFPYSPLGMWMAEQSHGERAVPGAQSNTATQPILLKTAAQCDSVVEYERQFMFERSGAFRPLYYFSPRLPEDPGTIARPDGRWLQTLQFMWDHIPEADYPRVMLPTAPGLSRHDNNYADNPFLLSLVKLGHRGAFWYRWRERDQIIEEARAKGFDVPADA